MKADAIYRQIKHDIIHQMYQPTERLVEQVLTETFHSSRTPVRDALTKLAHEGWVIKVEHQGYYVRSFTIPQIRDIYQVAAALEVLTVRLVIEQGDREMLESLDRTWHAMPRTWEQTDGLRLLDADEQFHVELAALSRNEELLKLTTHIVDQKRVCRRIDFTDKTWANQLVGEHLSLLERLMAGDEKGALDLVHAHQQYEMDRIGWAGRPIAQGMDHG